MTMNPEEPGPRMLGPHPADGTWLFVDEFGQLWRLKPTGEPDMPLTIVREDNWW